MIGTPSSMSLASCCSAAGSTAGGRWRRPRRPGARSAGWHPATAGPAPGGRSPRSRCESTAHHPGGARESANVRSRRWCWSCRSQRCAGSDTAAPILPRARRRSSWPHLPTVGNAGRSGLPRNRSCVRILGFLAFLQHEATEDRIVALVRGQRLAHGQGPATGHGKTVAQHIYRATIDLVLQLLDQAIQHHRFSASAIHGAELVHGRRLAVLRPAQYILGKERPPLAIVGRFAHPLAGSLKPLDDMASQFAFVVWSFLGLRAITDPVGKISRSCRTASEIPIK